MHSIAVPGVESRRTPIGRLPEREKAQSIISRSNQLVKDTLDLIILEVLNSAAHNGSDIMKEVRARTGLNVGPSTVYPLLYSMEQNGLVSGAWVSARRKMRLYSITEEGRLFRELVFKSLIGLLNATFEDMRSTVGPSSLR